MPADQSLQTVFNESQQKTAHFDLYKMEMNGSKIIMNIFPGTTGQSALTDIILAGQNPDTGKVGMIENYELGTDTDLNGKFLDVYTLVTDVAKDTNDTSIDFNLSGGTIAYRYFMQRTVQDEGDSIVYKVSIFFMSK